MRLVVLVAIQRPCAWIPTATNYRAEGACIYPTRHKVNGGVSSGDSSSSNPFLPFNFGMSYTSPWSTAVPFAVRGSLEIRILTGSPTTMTFPTCGPVVMKAGVPYFPGTNLSVETNGNFMFAATGAIAPNGTMIRAEGGFNPLNNTGLVNVMSLNEDLFVKTGLVISYDSTALSSSQARIGAAATVAAASIAYLASQAQQAVQSCPQCPLLLAP